MKKNTLAALFSVVAIIGATLFCAPSAYATKAPDCGKDTSGKDIAFCCGTDTSGNPIATSIDFGDLCKKSGASPITAILLWAIGFLAVGVGVAVVIGIILGGVSYAMSDGDAGKAKEGQEIIANAIIGLFLFIFLYAAANFIIPGGLFK